MQESRLFKIIYYILENGQATAPELAEKLEVSVRTIYRDIDALSEAGIPIYAETGRSGGFRLMNNFILDKALLSDEEKRDILAALQNYSIVANAADPKYTQDISGKLSALFHLPAENWYEIDFSRWGDKLHDNDKFEVLKYAVIHHQVVKIFYFNSYGKQEERMVQPVKLLYKSKEWYLKAFCRKKQGFRLFKLNRIIQYELLPETFDPAAFPEPKEFMQADPSTPFLRIRLRFAKDAAYRVYDEFDNSQIQQLENGDLLVCAKMPEDAWLIGFLLSFGTQVEIIEPLYLRDIIAEQAQKIYEKNSSETDKA